MQRFNITLALLITSFTGALTILYTHNNVTLAREDMVTQVTSIKSDRAHTQTLEWISATSSAPWGERDAHVIARFNNKLWLIGGLKGNDAVSESGLIQYWDAPHMSDVWSSSDGIHWDLVTDNAPWKNRRSVSAVPFKDKLWVMGGWDQYNYKYNNTIWVSDDGKNWITATSTPERWEGREGQVVIEYNDKLWLFGGVDFTKRITYNDVWVSEDGFTWNLVVKNAPWSERYDHAVATFKDGIYLTGGVHLNTHETDAEVWFSQDGINWEKREPEWPSRHGHISLVYKNKLWVIGGWHQDKPNKIDTGINDTWFTEDGVKWFKTQSDGPWQGREDHMGEVFRGKMWLTGGMNTDATWSGEIFYTEFEEQQ